MLKSREQILMQKITKREKKKKEILLKKQQNDFKEESDDGESYFQVYLYDFRGLKLNFVLSRNFYKVKGSPKWKQACSRWQRPRQ